MSGSLSVPIVIWADEPPSHQATALLYIERLNLLVTASSEKHLILWKLKVDERSLQTKIFLIGPTAPVSALCEGLSDTEVTHIISASENGELFCWDSCDGRCIETNRIAGNHTGLTRFPRLDGSLHILVHGLYYEIHVADAITLHKLFTLSSRHSADWIRCLTVIPNSHYYYKETIVAVNLSAHIKSWTVTGSSYHEIEPICEEKSKLLRLQSANHISFCLQNSRLMIIVTDDYWQLYDSDDFSLISSLPNMSEERWFKGDFLSVNKVLVWTKEGSGLIYQIPDCFNPDAKDYRSHATFADQVNEPYILTYIPRISIDCALGTSVSTLEFATQSADACAHLIRVDGNTRVLSWKIPKEYSKIVEPVPPPPVNICINKSLADIWKEHQPHGIINELCQSVNGQKILNVTCSLYISNGGLLVCGRNDGSIVLVCAIQAIHLKLLSKNHKQTGVLDHKIFKGHCRPVNCLCYPHQEAVRFEQNHLLSGSADFSVILWDMVKGTRLHTFMSHGGQVTRLLVPPTTSESENRYKFCVASVSSDHSICILNLSEKRVTMCASSHSFPVERIKWLLAHDWMAVQTSDSCVYVWQLKTGHLDRVITGPDAEEVLAMCDDAFSSSSSDVNVRASLKNIIKRRNLGMLRSIAAQHIVDISEGSNIEKEDDTRVNLSQPPLSIQPLRLSRKKSEVHLLFFDTESLVVQLISQDKLSSNQMDENFLRVQTDVSRMEQAHRITQASPKLVDRFQHLGSRIIENVTREAKGFLDTEDSTDTSASNTLKPETRQNDTSILDVAQLFMSCLHAWDVDCDLDQRCISTLKLTRPLVPVNYGIVSRASCISLMMPGWNSVGSTFEETKHWQLSNTLTTQHLLSAVTVANTLMNLRKLSSSNNASGVCESWSLVAALHCILLPDRLDSSLFKNPDLEELARRWQDRCQEIRQAAQAMLLAELRRMGESGRQRLVDEWVVYLPVLSAAESQQGGAVEKQPDAMSDISEEEDALSFTGHHPKEGGIISNRDLRRKQGMAVVMLGVLGAEFGEELTSNEKGSSLHGFGSGNVSIARKTCHALMYLLLRPPPDKVHSEVRRAAIELIGRGFPIWEPFLDISKVIIGFLELCVDGHLYTASLASGLPLNPAADSWLTAHHALSMMACSRPLSFITTMAKEVARYAALTASAPTSESFVHFFADSSSQAAVAALTTSVLGRAKAEILNIIEQLIDKQSNDVSDLLLETMDIIMHCLDSSLVKTEGLLELFPALKRFKAIAFCNSTKRILVGGKRGEIHMYDSRFVRPQVITNSSASSICHKGTITSLAFAPEGKLFASFCADDPSVIFWQGSGSIFNMISTPTFRCIKVCDIPKLDISVLKSVIKMTFISSRTVIILLEGGSQLTCNL